ncbi:MAG: glycosyltransferase family 2 protein [Bacteroidales bacterium]|nr:glycosyltransferase family 2 protein [Bacteroidales bacterium]MCF8333040.1 glycosyltransferase family 2 protein [Bacteroidales bacterium]
MESVSQINMIIQILLLGYFGLSALYFFVFAMASVFDYSIKKSQSSLHRFAVMIPGYEEDDVILHVIDQALQQNYPSDKYHVIVIADSFREETMEAIRQKPVILIEVSFESSTKAKALNKAMEKLPEENYDIALVLDADNIMEKDFLQKINEKFTGDQEIIQGHRVALNTDTTFSLLDAISEEINNNVFRKGHRNLGLSSALIGSGMAFRYSYFKESMKRIKAIGGFDKELELLITRERKTIDYHHNAYVKDEKIQSSASFSKQRKRWLAAQVNYLQKNFPDAFKLLVQKGNVDYFNKVLQFLQLPRLLLLGGIILINVFSLIFNPMFLMILWLAALGVIVGGFVFSVPRRFYTIKTLKALFYLPQGFFLMLKSLIFHSEARKKFIHTKHTSSQNHTKNSS